MASSTAGELAIVRMVRARGAAWAPAAWMRSVKCVRRFDDLQLHVEDATKTQAEIEAAISDGVRRFGQDYMGRRPKDIQSHLIGDLPVDRLQDVMTADEQQSGGSVPAEKGEGDSKSDQNSVGRNGPAGAENDGSEDLRSKRGRSAPRRKYGDERRDRTHHPSHVARAACEEV